MRAVVRETFYSPDCDPEKTEEFKRFQAEHENQEGYRGTVVVNAGNGRYLTLTLWDSAEQMDEAREAMGAVIGETIAPLMSESPNLPGTGAVVFTDLVFDPEESGF